MSKAFPFSPEQIAADNFGEIWKAAPVAHVGAKAIKIEVVARRCVYLNNYRIAGGKPYFSENLPSHTLKTTLSEVLDAFPEADVRKALAERKARKSYFAAYHAARKTAAELDQPS